MARKEFDVQEVLPMFSIEWVQVTMQRDFPKPVFVISSGLPATCWLAQVGPARKNAAVVRPQVGGRFHYWHKASGEWQEAGNYVTLEQAQGAVQRDVAALV